MIQFAIRATLHQEGFFEKFSKGEIDAFRIYSQAMWEGVNDYDDDAHMVTSLDDVVAIIPGGYALTYSKDEDIFDVWEQIWA